MGRFTTAPAPAETADARAAQFIDYDSDGLLDLFLLTARGPRLLRNLGREWTRRHRDGHSAGDVRVAWRCHVARHRRSGWRRPRRHRRARPSGVAVWRNSGGSGRPDAARPTDVARQQPLGRRREDRDARRQPQAAARDLCRDARPGARRHPSSASAIAPAPTSSACSGRRASCRPRPARRRRRADALERRDEDRRARSQALVVPVPVYVEWRAVRVHHRLPRRRRDGLLAGARRAQHAGPRRVRPHRRQTGFAPANGRYELRVTNELEESLFLDRVQLVAVAIRSASTCIPTRVSSPSRDRSRCTTARAAAAAARRDRRARVTTCSTGSARIDRRYRGRIRPRARSRLRRRTHAHLDLAACRACRTTAAPDDGLDRLCVLGRQRRGAPGGPALLPPSLEVKGPDGRWRTAIDDIGMPVGRPQTVAVDLEPRDPVDRARGPDQDHDADLLGPGSRRYVRRHGAAHDHTARPCRLRTSGGAASRPKPRLMAVSPTATTTRVSRRDRRGSSCPAATRARATSALLLLHSDDMFVVSRAGR